VNSKVQRYVIEQLAAAGFAVLSARVAFKLRPDVWASAMNCGGDFSEALPKLRQYVGSLPGVSLFETQMESTPDWVMVATRSTNMLSQRIEWVTGESLNGLRPVTEVKPTVAPRAVDDADRIPSWPCTERTERLRALGIQDDLASGTTKFPPRRAGL
jgi:hypothetical protein